MKSLQVSYLTSNKHIGRVRLEARFSVDTQSVEALVLFVEVDQGECSLLSTPVHLYPFRGLEENIWTTQPQSLLRFCLYYMTQIQALSIGDNVLQCVMLPLKCYQE